MNGPAGSVLERVRSAPRVAADRVRRAPRRTIEGLRRARSELTFAHLAPWIPVFVAVGFNLWVLRAERLTFRYLNDSAVHEQMARWAQRRMQSGHFPMDGWYPNLSLGSSRFHHYASLPHILTGLAGRVLGTDHVFAWSVYLLLSLAPLAVYWGARLLGWGRWAAGLAAMISPLVVAGHGIGYEYGSYLFRGSGVWGQLWGMWTLPLAWGFTWRAISLRKSYVPAVLFVGLTVAFHLLTGYLALLSIGVLVLVRFHDIPRRLLRGAIVGIGALLVSAFTVVPLFVDRAWTIQSEYSRGTYFYDSYGAKKILGWLFTGHIFDGTRLIPVVSVLVGAGMIALALRWRKDERARALLGLFGLSLLLYFGRPTLGPVLKLLPGSSDLFLNRYIIGVHLAGVMMAGAGMARIGGWVITRVRASTRGQRVRPAYVALAMIAAWVGVLTPAWLERASYAGLDGTWIHVQRQADATDGRNVAELVAIASRMGPGRFYAGTPTNWGSSYRIGFVPVYLWLVSEDVDEFGFPRPTFSLSSPMEYRFNESVPQQFNLFDIRYLILPKGHPPPVEARLVATRGRHTLWTVPTTGYLQVVNTYGRIYADRTNLGTRAGWFLDSHRLRQGLYPTIGFAGRPAPDPTVQVGTRTPGAPGVVRRELDGLDQGIVAGTVQTDRASVVLLKASFDPRWQATVDGVPQKPEMIAPSYVGVRVGPGTHQVLFEYRPYPYYRLLILVALLTLFALQFGPTVYRRVTGFVAGPQKAEGEDEVEPRV